MNRFQNLAKELEQQAKSLIEMHQVPGLSLGVFHHGETFTTGYGVTHIEHSLPVTDETLFQIGSISKTFTTTALLRLVDQGKVNLDNTVQHYFPKFKVADEQAASRATIRNLLTHTTGWVGDFFKNTGSDEQSLARYVDEMAGLEQLAPINTAWSYNNANFSVAGLILEQLTGKTYEAAIKELVFDPLGLTCCFEAGDVITHRFAVGHQLGADGVEVARPWGMSRAGYPVGGIVTDIKNLLKFAQFHLGDGQTSSSEVVLKQETLKQMHSPQQAIWPPNEAMGLSWFINDSSGLKRLYHDGGTNGQMALLTLVPDEQFAVAVLTNSSQGMSVTHALTQWILQQQFDFEPIIPQASTTTSEELQSYVGHYERPFSDIDVNITEGNLGVKLTYKQGFPTPDSPPQPSPPEIPCQFCEPDRLMAIGGPVIADFIRHADGSIGWVRVGHRIHKRTAN